MNLFLALVLATTPTSVELAEQDAFRLGDRIEGTRYLSLDHIEADKREDYLPVVSFVLNSVSSKKQITLPRFVGEDKQLVSFNLRDYGLTKDNYDVLGKNKMLNSEKLKVLLRCDNPILKVDYFIINATKAPKYYKLIGVDDLRSFKRRVGYNSSQIKKINAEQGAVVTNGMSRNTQNVRRAPLLHGYFWETRDNFKDDTFLQNMLSEEFDMVQIIASNYNGLQLYYAGDSKYKNMNYLDPLITFDSTRTLPDVRSYVSRNCMFCHAAQGVLPFKDVIRDMRKQEIEIKSVAKDDTQRVMDLFSGEFPFKSDTELYQKALIQATGMNPKKFADKFIAVTQRYYSEVPFKQVAAEFGMNENEFSVICRNSIDLPLLILSKTGKMRRDALNNYLGE